jgi:hypothetical protein
MTQGIASLLSDSAESGIQSSQVPQHGEVVIESSNGGDPGHCDQALTGQRAGIGIIVFSSTCKTLYANQAAYEFLKLLNRWESSHATDGALPGAIAGLYDQMELSLARRMMNGDSETLEERRLLMGEGLTVQLNAFGLRDRLGVQGSRVVITMKVHTHPSSDESNETIPASI